MSSTAAARATKPHTCRSSPKVQRLSTGARAMVSVAPPRPSHSDQRRTTATILAMSRVSPRSTACEMSRTLLWRVPRLAAVLMVSSAWLKRPKSPTPTGPIHRATSLVRTIEHTMPAICTPPKMPMAFMATRDMLLLPAITVVAVRVRSCRCCTRCPGHPCATSAAPGRCSGSGRDSRWKCRSRSTCSLPPVRS